MELSLGTCGWRRVKSLLLLHLFVVNGAADCPQPQAKTNIVLTNDALLKNEFPEGSEITFECAHGYDKSDGSGIATCVGGKWTEPTLSCQKRDCGLPLPKPHMMFDVSEGTLFGAAVQVSCEAGYQLSGTTYMHCYALGWAGRAKCEVVTCPHPAEIKNGRNSWDSQEEPEYGAKIEYYCALGYTLTGNSVITCTETSEYNLPPPECEGGTDILTTDDKITPTTATSTTPPTVEGGTNILATEVFTSTTHRDKIITTSAAPSAPTTVRGGRDILATEDNITTTTATSAASPPGRGEPGEVIKSNSGMTPVIVSVICTALVVPIVVFAIYYFLLKRKGSPNGTVPIY